MPSTETTVWETRIADAHLAVSVEMQALECLRASTHESAPAQLKATELAAMIDHTLLKADVTPDMIDELCAQAREYHFASVCVNPGYVAQCAWALKGSEVMVCSVVGFPLGATLPEVKAFEAAQAIDDGAREIDMVMNVGALKARAYSLVKNDIAAVADVCHANSARCKVIIEAPLLTDEEKVAACLLAVEAGADFCKTSTGFASGGATVEDVALMRAVVGPDIGVKAAGGIRTYETALAMIDAGATRIGASASIAIVKDAPA